MINGKIYIGQSADCQQRWRQHKSEAKKHKPTMVINMAMKKYGVNNFAFEVIASCKTQNNANDTETLLVSQYESHVSTGKGYNVSNGGSNAPKTEKWKQKMQEYHNDPSYIENQKQKMVKYHAAHPEHGQQLSQQSKEMWQNREYREFMKTITKPTQFKKGHEVSDYVRQRVSECTMGRVPWNKGTKGVCKANSGSRKKGEGTGENNPTAKLNWSIVKNIRKDYVDGLSYSKLAIKYNISKSTIYQVVKHKTWRI